MRLLWRYVLVVAGLMAVSVLLTACGGDGDGEELTLDEYFQRIEEIADAAEIRAGGLDEESLGAGEGAEIEAFLEYFDDFEAIFEDTLNDMKEIRPPAEVREAHDEFVDALEETQQSFKDLSDRVADMESLSGLEALVGVLEDVGFKTTAENFDQACRNLQGIADENGIDVDLGCE